MNKIKDFEKFELSLALEYYNEHYSGDKKDKTSAADALAWIRLSLPPKFWKQVVQARFDASSLKNENDKLSEFKRLLSRNQNLLDGLREYDKLAAQLEDVTKSLDIVKHENKQLKQILNDIKQTASGNLPARVLPVKSPKSISIDQKFIREIGDCWNDILSSKDQWIDYKHRYDQSKKDSDLDW